MRRVSIKAESELPELKEKVRLQIVDGAIEAIIIGEGDTEIRVTKSGTYSEYLKVTKPQAKDSKEVYVITGQLLGLSEYRSEEFERYQDAADSFDELKRQHGINLGLEIVADTIWFYTDNLL